MPPDKARLGKRYTCFSCGAHFYDLNKPEAVCPACGADQAENPNPDPRELILAKYKGKGGAKPAKREAEPEEDEGVPEEDEFLRDSMFRTEGLSFAGTTLTVGVKVDR